jgi:tellurite resistance protein
MFGNNAGGGGFFALLVGIGLIAAENNKSGSANPTNQASPQTAPLSLQIKVSTKTEILDGLSIELLHFHTKGIFSAYRTITRPCFEFRMSDVTDAHNSIGGIPVLCVIDELQEDTSTVFRFQQKYPSALNAGAGSPDWVQLGSVPKVTLVFPNAGNRKIKVILRVTDEISGQLITSTDTVWTTLVEGNGYLEAEAIESRGQAAIIQLAMCTAASDSIVNDDEVSVIKAWGERTVNALPDTRQVKRRTMLNDALQIATAEIRAHKIPQLEDAAIAILKGMDEVRMFYDAYELCLHVVKANGEAHPEEMAQLTRIARKLGLDETKIRILTDRHLSDVAFPTGASESDDDHYLGITSDMSMDEIRKHLNKLFDKHQARTTHDKPEVRKKAKEWLERIATARLRHLG